MSSSGIPIIDGGIKPAQKQQPQYANSPIGPGVMENGVVNLMPDVFGEGLTYNPQTQEYIHHSGLFPGVAVSQDEASKFLHPDYSAMAAHPQVIAENWTPTYRSFQYGVPDYPVPQTRTPYQVGPNYSQFQGNPGLQSVANQQPSYRPFMMPQSLRYYQVGPDYGRLMRPSMPQRMFRPQPQTASIQHPQQPFNPFRITSRTPR